MYINPESSASNAPHAKKSAGKEGGHGMGSGDIRGNGM